MSLVNFVTVTVATLLIKIVCLLITVAYYTLAERKIMASVQRRLGPNVVGFWGLLQPLADALKLVGKELVIPTHANSRIFVFAPIGVLMCAFLPWAIIPFQLFDHSTYMSAKQIAWGSYMEPGAPVSLYKLTALAQQDALELAEIIEGKKEALELAQKKVEEASAQVCSLDGCQIRAA